MLRRMPFGFYAWVGMMSLTLTIGLPRGTQAAPIPLSGLLVDKVSPLDSKLIAMHPTGWGTPRLSSPPSGDNGRTSVDFGSLRAPLNLPRYLIRDTLPESLINYSPVGETYDTPTDAYSLQWLNNFSITLGSSAYARAGAGNADLSLVGSATTVVPLPVAVWLSGSGLLGMVAVARRKNQRSFFRPPI